MTILLAPPTAPAYFDPNFNGNLEDWINEFVLKLVELLQEWWNIVEIAIPVPYGAINEYSYEEIEMHLQWLPPILEDMGVEGLWEVDGWRLRRR